MTYTLSLHDALPIYLALVFRIARPGGEMEAEVEDGRRPGELAVSCIGFVIYPSSTNKQQYSSHIPYARNDGMTVIRRRHLCRPLNLVHRGPVVQNGTVRTAR